MTEPGAPLARADFELREPGPGRALVRVAGCGVCHTDLGFMYEGVRPRAGLPLALGHEISGEVVAAAPGFEHLVGRAVIVPAVTPCGRCDACRRGRGAICAAQEMPGNDIPGGFASHVDVPARGLCVVDLPPAAERAAKDAPIGRSGCSLAELAVVADALTTPYRAVKRAEVEPGDFAVVVGLGGVGAFAAQVAGARGATVVGFDVDPRRLELCARHGLAAGLDPRGKDPKALRGELRALAAAHGASAERWKIFECSGSAAGQTLAWELLGPGASLSVIGFTRERIELRLSNLMAFDAVAVGSWGCPPELYPEALELVLGGEVALKPFVETWPMDRIGEVLTAAHEHRLARRPVLVP
jgi:6-hydroxycyclohex-1-ene-1-carbonyl-CoA dehydrogenase